MTKKRFIRTISGQIYDTENEKFYHEDYEGKPLEYDDDVIMLLNSLSTENRLLIVENEEFNEELMEYDSFKRLYEEKIERLEKEKEQLKLRIKELEIENQGIQNKVIKLLDFVEVKQCVTRTEIKKWWNND